MSEPDLQNAKRGFSAEELDSFGKELERINADAQAEHDAMNLRNRTSIYGPDPDMTSAPIPGAEAGTPPTAADALRSQLASLTLPQPTGYNVLLAIYVRAEAKDLGGGKKLYFADKTRDEDKYQGKVGLVLSVGPEAYSDKAKFPSGAWCKPGDWVLFPAYETASSRFTVGGVPLATVLDDRIIATIADPTEVI